MNLILGRPKPRVRWQQSGLPLGTSSEVSSGSTVTSTVILESLNRTDNGLLLTCEASNNNISKPVRHSVSLLMNRKLHDLTLPRAFNFFIAIKNVP